MPPIETSFLHDKAVLWAFAGQDSEGELQVGSPEEIDVGVTLGPLRTRDRPNNTTPLDSIAYVDQDIEANSILWLGAMAEWLASPVATWQRPLLLVLGMKTVDDTKGRNKRRTLSLQFYRKLLPAIA